MAHGHWQVVGHCKVRTEEVPWPAYKEGVSPPGTYDVVDHTGRRRRRATLQEAERLPFRTVVAPILLEKALRALHGAEPWDEIYDGMRLVESDRTAAALQLT